MNIFTFKKLFLLLLFSISIFQSLAAQEKILLLQERDGNKITGIKQSTIIKICFKDAAKDDIKGSFSILNKTQISIANDTILLDDVNEIQVPNVKANATGKALLITSGTFAGLAIFGGVVTAATDDLGAAILTVVSIFMAVPFAVIAVPFKIAKKRFRLKQVQSFYCRDRNN